VILSFGLSKNLLLKNALFTVVTSEYEGLSPVIIESLLGNSFPMIVLLGQVKLQTDSMVC
jgi:hypothetical protein